MKKINLPIIGAVITALLSTMCCLPAFLFIFFGISSGVLTYITNLDYLRIPLAILAIIFFILGIRRHNKKNSCACSMKQAMLNTTLMVVAFFIFLFALFYPEIIPFFMEA